ncbi:hypothetical protein SK571_18100 [Lentzea sp. BCCO 10_0798]|uniref:Excreted virulence factor EspC, type VII ESX diderm n=1 Tax=Lentzea kristufekii TaxID=3095430 RepID=A0ABU4TSP6_9PSEU|nr:hypothetical protein [Lentzea sp. BCCO 10_0798]MDX8051305.1 hypothetical protein [Lentzea sp. BCCO 10_0798]
MSGFQADLKALEAHERELKALLAGLPSAADAGADYVGNPQAWGLIGQFFAIGMELWTNDARAYVDAVKAAGEGVVERFADMRQAYEDQEASMAATFKKLRENLDGVQP